jgi:hypothetical protein
MVMLAVSATQEASDMDWIDSVRARLEHAGELPAVLDAAYDAFEDMLGAIEVQQDPSGGAFAAFVMAGAAAANGRNAGPLPAILPERRPGHLAAFRRKLPLPSLPRSASCWPAGSPRRATCRPISATGSPARRPHAMPRASAHCSAEHQSRDQPGHLR